ncbi:MAG TPA: nucleotidyltransferase domain-containing protein [Gemmatimonadales bacterium]
MQSLPPARPRGAKDLRPLAQALPSTACARVVVALALRPEHDWRIRELMRLLGLSPRSVTTELNRLVRLGALEPPSTPGAGGYRAAVQAEAWQCFARLVRVFATPDEVLRPALSQVPGLQRAWLFGSFGSGTERDESDVDVLILGEAIDDAALSQATADAGRVLGRDVNPVVLTPREWREMTARQHPFALSVLRQPRQDLMGPLPAAGQEA